MGLLAFLLMLGFDSMFLAALMLAVVPLGIDTFDSCFPTRVARDRRSFARAP